MKPIQFIAATSLLFLVMACNQNSKLNEMNATAQKEQYTL